MLPYGADGAFKPDGQLAIGEMWHTLVQHIEDNVFKRVFLQVHLEGGD